MWSRILAFYDAVYVPPAGVVLRHIFSSIFPGSHFGVPSAAGGIVVGEKAS